MLKTCMYKVFLFHHQRERERGVEWERACGCARLFCCCCLRWLQQRSCLLYEGENVIKLTTKKETSARDGQKGQKGRPRRRGEKFEAETTKLWRKNVGGRQTTRTGGGGYAIEKGNTKRKRKNNYFHIFKCRWWWWWWRRRWTQQKPKEDTKIGGRRLNRIESLESLESRGKSGESRGNLARAKQKKENPNSYAIFLFFCGRAGEWTPPPLKKRTNHRNIWNCRRARRKDSECRLVRIL